MAPQPFSSCCIGSAGHRTTTTTTGLPAPVVPTALAPTHPSLTRSQSVPATAGLGWGSGLGAPPQEGSISSTLAGTQDTRWGSPTSLEGELGAVAIFHEALPTAALQALCSLGRQPTPSRPSPCPAPAPLRVPTPGGWSLKVPRPESRGLGGRHPWKSSGRGSGWGLARGAAGSEGPANLQGPTRQPPSSPRATCTNSAPSCSCITHLRYWGQRCGLTPLPPPAPHCLPPPST